MTGIIILQLGFSMLFSAIGEASDEGNIVVDCDFPGGNIIMDAIEGDDVFLHQDLRDTQGHWFYWYFRVRGAAGRALNFAFTKGDVIGVLGPAVSMDCGRSGGVGASENVSGAVAVALRRSIAVMLLQVLHARRSTVKQNPEHTPDKPTPEKVVVLRRWWSYAVIGLTVA